MSQDYDIWRLLGDWETGEGPPDDGEGVIDLPPGLWEKWAELFGAGGAAFSRKKGKAVLIIRGIRNQLECQQRMFPHGRRK